ncbi:hypothetical protein, unknown function [Leishmania tarentolae]|uniref:Secreted protein n=1 Tax=Leishmania tarentolae TaxID=5689 RepID=A0A640KCU9_LEITA|nr:hypothetical protein, unknown function [Leishmania tarentolae]
MRICSLFWLVSASACPWRLSRAALSLCCFVRISCTSDEENYSRVAATPRRLQLFLSPKGHSGHQGRHVIQHCPLSPSLTGGIGKRGASGYLKSKSASQGMVDGTGVSDKAGLTSEATMVTFVAHQRKDLAKRYGTCYEDGTSARCVTCQMVKIACSCQSLYRCYRFLMLPSCFHHRRIR